MPLVFLFIYGPTLFTALLVLVLMGLIVKWMSGRERVIALLVVGIWGVAACIHFLPDEGPADDVPEFGAKSQI